MALSESYTQRDIDRFMAKVSPEPNSGCWLWTGCYDQGGYGRFSYHRVAIGAHRFSYLIAEGKMPPGKEIDHLCRVRCCVNPAHLEPVTRRENALRGIAGAVNTARQRGKTHCPRGHPYAGGNLYLYGPNKYRFCRKCNAEKKIRARNGAKS